MFFEKIPLKEEEFFIVRQTINLGDSYPFHTHPEYELIVVMNASGRRFVGNSFSDFRDYDMALIGPNLPHRWTFEKFDKRSRVLVLQFRGSILENPFFKMPGLKNLQILLTNAWRGIEFLSKKNINIIDKKLNFLKKTKTLDSLIEFLNVMSILCKSKNNRFLSTEEFPMNVSQVSMKKIDSIFNYIFKNFTTAINLRIISDKFYMSKAGFCIFFKKHTGKNFSEFMNELRINYASNLLLETDIPVSDICFKSGYNNLSYFNRIFKSVHKVSPVEYRKIY